jgi:hypothetical protein
MPKDILDEIKQILQEVRTEKKGVPYLTALQIFERLDNDLRERLIRERGMPGKGAGAHYSAVSLVTDAADIVVGGDEVIWLETPGLSLTIGSETRQFGSRVARLYRLPQ